MRSRGESFRNALELHVFFAHLADHKYARAAPAIQKAHFGAGFRAQNLPQMPGFLPFKKRCIAPVFRGQIKKRYAHATTFSLPLRALRTALNPSCNETRRL